MHRIKKSCHTNFNWCDSPFLVSDIKKISFGRK